jgi:putative transport protein
MDISFADQPLLLLFVVAAVGYFIGKVRIKGSSLGVSAVLFVGLGFGAINADYNVPNIIFELGLVFFVYSIGLSSGPAFFKSFQQNGMRDIIFVLTMLLVSALVAVGMFFLMGLDAATITGIYAGSTTNTPALASVIDLVNQRDTANSQSLTEALVVGYTYSYIMGVIGVMIVLKLMERVFKIDYVKEKEILRKRYPLEENLTSRSIRVTNAEINGKSLRDINNENGWNVLYGRIENKEGVSLSNWDTKLYVGDNVMVIGSNDLIEEVQDWLGEESVNVLKYDRRDYDVRRIFVSKENMAGRSISSLNLNEKYSAIITRIRRGDLEILAQGDTVLEMGDRIRFIARRKDLRELALLFGDSYFKSSQVNLFSFGLGIALGMLLGMITWPLPGGLSFKLGMAGGPLIVGLLLGAVRRTGPINWTLPYGANVTLRQMGLIFLLAVIGLRSGNTFLESLGAGSGLLIFAAGSFLSMVAAFLSIVIGYKIFKIPFSLLLGFMSNQPAILDFAMDMSKNKVPLIGYSLMFPIALVMKILFAQMLFIVLG